MWLTVVVLAQVRATKGGDEHAHAAGGHVAASHRPEKYGPPRRFIDTQLEPFAAVYARRPGGSNVGGAAFFHYFALWCIVRWLKPLHIIESGCFAGIGSWFLRQAAGEGTNMTFLSPEVPSLYVDRHAGSRHLFGSDFRDFSEVGWEVRLSPRVRNATLIFFDDHQAGIRRTLEAARFGFGHAVFDDNYLPPRMMGKGGDNFALHFFNLPPSYRAAPEWRDNFNKPSSRSWFAPNAPLGAADVAALERIYNATVRSYFEFPPVWHGPNRFHIAPAVWHELTKPPVLKYEGAKEFAAKHGLDMNGEAVRYTHICYVQLARGAR